MPALMLLASSQPANADLVPPSSRRLAQYFSIANASAFPNYVFMSYPTHEAQPRIVVDATPVAFDKILGAKIYAATAAGFDRTKVLAMKPEAQRMYFGSDRVRVVPLAIAQVPRVVANSELQSIEDVIVIDSIDPGSIVAHFDKVIYTTSDGKKHEQPWAADGRPAFGDPPATPEVPTSHPEVVPAPADLPVAELPTSEPQRPAKATGGCAAAGDGALLLAALVAGLALVSSRRLARR